MSNSLVRALFDAADHQNLSQKELARRSGMAEASLSRLKHASDVRLSTLEKLAAAVGLQLKLAPADNVAEQISDGQLF